MRNPAKLLFQRELHIRDGRTIRSVADAIALLREPMARPDYVSVADAHTLGELQRVSGPALALVAGWVGRTRLADNMPLAWDVA